MSNEQSRIPGYECLAEVLHDRAVAELLGAINYLAGAVIAMEAKQREGKS